MRLRTVCVGACFALLALASAGALAGDSERGRALWRTGETGNGRLEAHLPGPGLDLAPALAACARCHGADAEGGEEGGVVVPPLAGRDLLAAGIEDAGDLAAVLQDGRSRKSVPLHPAMPRYRLDGRTARDLFAFLSSLGRAEEPGVGRDELILGVILPIQGPSVRQARRLHALYGWATQDLDARGGLYGRRIRLAILAAADGSDVAALRTALEAAPVLAVLSGLGIEPGGPEERVLAERGVPCLFALRPPSARTGGCRFELGVDHETLARLTVQRALRDVPNGGRLGLVPGAIAADGSLRAVLSQRTDVELVPVRSASEPLDLDVLIAGPGTDDAARLAGLADGPGIIFGHIDDLAHLRRFLRPGVSDAWRRLVLVDPHPPGALDLPAAARLRAWLGLRKDAELPALERLAYAAFAVTERALRSVGRWVTSARLIQAIENLSGFETGLLPPLDYARHPLHGLGEVRFITLDGQGDIKSIEPSP